MFCPNCGSEINDEKAKFCEKCGKEIGKGVILPKKVNKSQIKCLNCGYIGKGTPGRSLWAIILVLLFIWAPLIAIIYFLATKKWLCPQCRSEHVEEIDEQGKVVRRRNFLLIIVIIFVGIAMTGILASIVLVALGEARSKAKDAGIIADMNELRLRAEDLFDAKGHYGSLYCGGDQQVAELCADIENYATGPVTIKNNSSNYCAEVQLNSGGSYCIDSKLNAIENSTCGAYNTCQ